MSSKSPFCQKDRRWGIGRQQLLEQSCERDAFNAQHHHHTGNTYFFVTVIRSCVPKYVLRTVSSSSSEGSAFWLGPCGNGFAVGFIENVDIGRTPAPPLSPPPENILRLVIMLPRGPICGGKPYMLPE